MNRKPLYSKLNCCNIRTPLWRTPLMWSLLTLHPVETTAMWLEILHSHSSDVEYHPDENYTHGGNWWYCLQNKAGEESQDYLSYPLYCTGWHCHPSIHSLSDLVCLQWTSTSIPFHSANPGWKDPFLSADCDWSNHNHAESWCKTCSSSPQELYYWESKRYQQ